MMPRFHAANPANRRYFLFLALLISLAIAPHSAGAQPAKGTSAYAAARLKNHPPKNWIRHYLGDDRYKIAGGIWRVVSTEVDRYYYPAWAPEMLRQPAGIVIGFPSAAQAEEAGYLPSTYGSGDALYGLTVSEIAVAKNRNGVMRGPIPFSGTRITLSDGRSTVILPKGWKHIPVKVNRRSQTKVTYLGNDVLQFGTGKNKQAVTFAFMTTTNVSDVAPYLTPQRFREFDRLMSQSVGSTPMVKSNKEVDLKVAMLGSLKGVRLGLKSSAFAGLPKEFAAVLGNLGILVVGRGSKIYMMTTSLTPNSAAYKTTANSFQPR